MRQCKFQNILILFIILTITFSCSDKDIDEKQPPVDYGLLDLSSWDFESDGYIKLDGEWEFYWNRLLTPSDLNFGSYPSKTGIINVPGLWNNKEIGETIVKRKGFATYRLFIQFNNRYNLYSLKTGRIESAHKMWINNELVLQNGIVGESKETSVPKWNSTDLYFETDSSIIEIVLQVSNFHNSHGGISESIYFGLPKQINRHVNTQRSYFIF